MIATEWTDRNPIIANLLNPAFCGEILRVTMAAYNKKSKRSFPFLFTFIVLPMLLHKRTRELMPNTTRTYLFVWIEENDSLFFDFAQRAKGLVKYSNEAILFLKAHDKIILKENGELEAKTQRVIVKTGPDSDEYNNIMKKAEMLGKWLTLQTDVKSVYSFLRIMP